MPAASLPLDKAKESSPPPPLPPPCGEGTTDACHLPFGTTASPSPDLVEGRALPLPAASPRAPPPATSSPWGGRHRLPSDRIRWRRGRYRRRRADREERAKDSDRDQKRRGARERERARDSVLSARERGTEPSQPYPLETTGRLGLVF